MTDSIKLVDILLPSVTDELFMKFLLSLRFHSLKPLLGIMYAAHVEITWLVDSP